MALRTAARREASQPSFPSHLRDGGNNTDPCVCFGDRTIKEHHLPHNEGTDGLYMKWKGRERSGGIKRERCRQNQAAKCNNLFREREKGRERGVQGGYDVVKKYEPSCRMQTACTE